jgi:hypothetical protein
VLLDCFFDFLGYYTAVGFAVGFYYVFHELVPDVCFDVDSRSFFQVMVPCGRYDAVTLNALYNLMS